MINLPNVTLVSISCYKYGETLASLKKSLAKIKPAKTLFFTDAEILTDGVECVKIDKLSWDGYSEFVIKELYKYIDTDFVLIVQWDSWVLDESVWSDDFLNYDYIGAAWLDGVIGNGGGSLRSRRFQEHIAKDDFIQLYSPEDAAICRIYRSHLEDCGFSFAPREVADRFAFELNPPLQKTFMFHGFHHKPYKDHVVVKRSGAMGDIIMAEPLLAHLHNEGYQVVLDCPIQYISLFQLNHPYPIMHISQMDERLSPKRFIDLDMAYEKQPKLPVLAAYAFEAGVKHMTMRNSQLFYPVDARNRMFKKYVVIHNQDTAMSHRNIKGVDWRRVVRLFEASGYFVVQVGGQENEVAGTWVNTNSLAMLMYVLAGAELVIANDSGVAQIAVALGRPSVIFFGSVNPSLRYSDFNNIRVVQNRCPIGKDFCYHEVVSETGQDCEVDKILPPCTKYDTDQVINAIKSIVHV